MNLLFIYCSIFLVWAVWVDHRTLKIPNYITYSMILAGLIARITLNLPRYEYFLGVLIASIVAFALHYRKVWGGGDTKLLVGIGGFLGPPQTLMYSIILILTIVTYMFLNSIFNKKKKKIPLGICFLTSFWFFHLL